MSDPLAPEAQAFPRAIVAATCWLAYDSLICLEEEIRLIWRSAWSIPKALYLACRYGGLALSISYSILSTTKRSSQGCPSFAALCLTLGAVLITIPADGLFLMRVWALFRNRIWLCRVLLAYYVVEKTVEVGINCFGVVLGWRTVDATDDPQCLVAYSDTILYTVASLIPAVVFNCVLFGLTLVKVAPYWRLHEYAMAPLLHAIVRDGAVYFVMICCLLIVVMFIYLFLDVSYARVIEMPLDAWIIAGYPIAACRLLLQLRCRVNRPTLDTTVRTADARVPTRAARGPGGSGSLELSTFERTRLESEYVSDESGWTV